ncbi:dihydroxyacid dehydratase/phosphogluconate dehydratase [Prauserella sp. Am3]|nr:dihydroxyacid dehydratase/phosphogluconate dehydratase [Prauserella sp. Am3]
MTATSPTPEPPNAPSEPARRSTSWFGADGKMGFVHRSKLYNSGRSPAMFDGRPVIGICNSWSELTPCNRHLRDIAEAVKRGVLLAGGFPLEFPTMSLGETLMRPSAMLYRNLMAMEVEENIRSYPLDGVVLLAGCDKTVPAQLMGALSADLPAIMLTGGPMLNGKFRGQDAGSGTHVWQFAEEVRAGRMSREEFGQAEACLSRSAGHCTTMGTASTMACLVEMMGLALPGSAAVPAVDAERARLAEQSGGRIVELVTEDLRPSSILDRRSFENAARFNAAIGGSTNALVHLSALAGRAEVDFPVDEFDRQARDIPLLVDLLPSGRFLMEEFSYAGGVPAVVAELGDRLHGDARTVTGRTVAENYAGARNWNTEVVRPLAEPVQPAGSATAVLHGNLAPDGAVIKLSAASPELTDHVGTALVFDTVEEYYERCDDPDLPVEASTVLVVRGAGPRGYPGMPEIGNLSIPKKLLDAGVRDIVRITDGRMSGTSYGTIVLHVAPESAAGGPLSLLRSGDRVHLAVAKRRIDMLVDDEELARRAEQAPPAGDADAPTGGWAELYRRHVGQADTGADLDFLRGRRGHAIPRRHL